MMVWNMTQTHFPASLKEATCSAITAENKGCMPLSAGLTSIGSAHHWDIKKVTYLLHNCTMQLSKQIDT